MRQILGRRPGLRFPLLISLALGRVLSAQSAHAAEGKTPGSFATSPTGAATYSIPIWTPPGPNGIQPNIALVYSSQAGVEQTGENAFVPTGPHSAVQVTYDGYLGVGWTLGGLSAITRCNLTVAEDPVAAAVALKVGDGYCLDGQRLRLTSGVYGADGSTWQTEVANFANVTASGSAGGGGPASFVVQQPNGVKYYYGSGGNSQVLANNSSIALKWLLSEVVDPAGNTMTITYTSTTGDAVPSIISWTPSSHGSSTYNYTMTFGYTTNAAPSSIYKYVAGTSVSNVNLLNSITIAYSGTTVKKYVLTYQSSLTTGRERLSQVQECSDTGATNCLLPTSITYQNGTAGISTTASTFTMGSAATGWYLPHYDLNGDGYKDLVFQVGTTWYVAWGSAMGYSAPISTNISTPVYSPGHGQLLAGDLLGSGQDVLLANNAGTWSYYAWDGAHFFPTSTGLSYDTSAFSFALADTDGDGLPDLVSVNATAVYIYHNQAANSSTIFAAASTAFTIPPLSGFDVNNGTFVTPDSQRGGPLRRFDFDGDGRDDLHLAIDYFDSPDHFHTHTRYWLLANGNTFNATQTTDIPTTFVNWNNDGCTDWITGTTLTISACNGNSATTIALGYTPLTSMDWDGDGRTDLVYVSGTNLSVQLSTGVGLGATINTGITYNSSGFNYWGADVNGDGLDDLEFFLLNGTTLTLNSYFHNGGGQKPDLATSFTDGYGNSASPTYVSLVQNNYTPNSGSAPGGYYPYTKPLYVASQVVYSDPTSASGGTWNQQYWYYSGIENPAGYGFQGFGEMRTIDSRNGLYDYQYFLTSFPYTGMLYKEVLALSNGTNIRQALGTQTVTNLSTTAWEQRYFPYFNNWTVQQWELGGAEAGQLITTASTNYTFDVYGNPTTIVTTVTDKDPGSPSNPYNGVSWTTTTTNTPNVDTTNWCLRLSTQTQVAYTGGPPGAAAVTRTMTFPSPDTARCRYTQIVTEPNSSQFMVTEALGYDPTAGTLLTDTVTGAGMTARTTTYTWDPVSLFPTSIRDPSGALTQLSFNYSFGVLGSLTDLNSTAQTPIVTSWQFDPFGRKTQETRPDGTYTVWAYNDCGSYGGCLISNHSPVVARYLFNTDGSNVVGPGSAIGAVYFDALDRPVVDNEVMLSSATSSRVEVRYDSLGRVVREAAPCTWSSITATCPYWTTNGFDALNRLTQSQRPISSTNSTLETTTYAYAGRTTTITDPLGHTRTLLNDVNGALRQTKDASGYYVALGYDAYGSPTLVSDSLGNTLLTATYAYGIAPFRLTAVDADLGPQSFGFDALGDMVSLQDAKGQRFTATYDALSRPLTRAEPDLFTQWTWGSSASNHNIGQLQSVCTGTGTSPTSCNTSGYAESETYDGLARQSQRSIQIPADATYTYTWAYNATTGLLDTLTYPSTGTYALQLKYAYTNGILASVTDVSDTPNVALWTATGMNPAGQITNETFGNNVQVSHAFDAVTHWASSITAGLNGGAGLQNNSYLFDQVGNLTQRQDNNAGVTENVYPDVVNRLDHTVGDTSTQMTYDSMGRISTWEANGATVNTKDYTTPQSGCTYYSYGQPHAVRKNTQGSNAISFCYDANGNVSKTIMNGTTSQTFSWTSFNQPAAISAPSLNSSSQFSYDHNHQRWMQSASYSGSPENTEYIGGLLEKMTSSSGTAYRYYVPAGNNYIVYNRWSNGSNPIYYVTKDNIDSSAAITNSTGGLVVKEKFAALGWNLNSGSDQTAMASVTRHEFTGQEGLDNAGLWMVNMNGRVYEPDGAFFISADPHVTDPLNPQSYNRYAYALNNPLTYIDPTGFDCFVPYPVPRTGDGPTGEYGPQPSCPNPATDPPGPPAPPPFSDPVLVPVPDFSPPPAPPVPFPPSAPTLLPGIQNYPGAPGSGPFDGGGAPGSEPMSVVTITAQRRQPYTYNPLSCVGGLNCSPPLPGPQICGWGAFGYTGFEGKLIGPVKAEVLAFVSYDSQVGGSHGGLIAGKAGPWSVGREWTRTWSDWKETASSVVFLNGVSELPFPTGPLKMTSKDYGGVFENADGQLQVGAYAGGTFAGRRAGGLGFYLSLALLSGCL